MFNAITQQVSLKFGSSTPVRLGRCLVAFLFIRTTLLYTDVATQQVFSTSPSVFVFIKNISKTTWDDTITVLFLNNC